MWSRLLARIGGIGARPGDSYDERLQKSLMVATSVMIIPAGLLWGLLYLSYDEPLTAVWPFAYSLLSLTSLVVFAAFGHFALFRTAQLLLIMLIPFGLQLSLGGFVLGSAVVVWSLFGPLGALLGSPRQAPYWFAAYVGLLLISGLAEGHLRPANNLPAWVITVFFILNVGVPTTIAFTLLRYFVGELEAEQQKSDNLLLNILPREVATALKNRPGSLAESFDSATVLFADVVDFTPLAAGLSPAATLDFLNTVFSTIDNLCDQHQLEKIKTIGDCYMVAAGVPRPRPDHARAAALMALEIREALRQIRRPDGTELNIRVGLASGPVVAGVIGRRKFVYDLWGDPVNIASRMETHGEPGQIQMTGETYELLKDDFICRPRGTVMVKGKGMMETWFLDRPRAS